MPDDPRQAPRDVMPYDVLIVGGGPSGLSCAIRLKQLAQAQGQDLSVCVIEKGAEIGAHILSGAVIEPRSLDELFPDWKERGAPLTVPVTGDKFLFLTAKHAVRLPTPPTMHNKGNFIISLGRLARWLAEQAEALGVEIYPGFAGAEILYDDNGRVVGVATGDMGIGKNGQPTGRFTRGVELRAKQTVFAEGCRGSLTRQISERLKLRAACDPQSYGLGIKELWEVDPAKHRLGFVQHTLGWPVDTETYGGSWLYHAEGGIVSIGFVVGLDYTNPTFSPFEAFQQFKQHPKIRALLEGGKRIAYGARALTEGGLQAIPKLTFPGGLLIGDTAGFMNVPKIKGIHTAMKSGMLAAEALIAHGVGREDAPPEVTGYPALFKASWLYRELHGVRNIRPAFHFGLLGGMIYSAMDSMVFHGHVPWTLHTQHADNERTRPINEIKPIVYPKPDGVVSFDRLSSVFLANVHHEEDQPAHLTLKDPSVAIDVNLTLYGSPESFYCPAGVYEIARDANGLHPHLVINASNCVHCKTCDIKDPTQNIVWVTPEGGGGPNYQGM